MIRGGVNANARVKVLGVLSLTLTSELSGLNNSTNNILSIENAMGAVNGPDIVVGPPAKIVLSTSGRIPALPRITFTSRVLPNSEIPLTVQLDGAVSAAGTLPNPFNNSVAFQSPGASVSVTGSGSVNAPEIGFASNTGWVGSKGVSLSGQLFGKSSSSDRRGFGFYIQTNSTKLGIGPDLAQRSPVSNGIQSSNGDIFVQNLGGPIDIAFGTRITAQNGTISLIAGSRAGGAIVIPPANVQLTGSATTSLARPNVILRGSLLFPGSTVNTFDVTGVGRISISAPTYPVTFEGADVLSSHLQPIAFISSGSLLATKHARDDQMTTGSFRALLAANCDVDKLTDGRIRILAGDAIIQSKRAGIVETQFGSISIAGKAIILLKARKDSLRIYNLSLSQDVVLLHEGRSVSILSGQEAIFANDQESVLQVASGVAQRQRIDVRIGSIEGRLSDFSFVSLASSDRFLRNLLQSKDSQDRKTAEQMMKCAAALSVATCHRGAFRYP